MAGAESPASGDAIPVLDVTARALDARRMHHRQIIRGLEVSFEIDPELEGILKQSRRER